MPRFAVRRRRPAAVSQSLSVTRHAVPCATCGGPAVASVALVPQGDRVIAEELEARCPRCGPRA